MTFLQVAGLVLCASACASAPLTPQLTAAAITEITLEQRCFGCPDEGSVTLRRDGTATKTTFGNARQGTQDRVARGAVSAAEFTALAAFVVTEKFDDLRDDYRTADIADGAWRTTTVLAGGLKKAVTDRDGAPAGLIRVQARIKSMAAAIEWK